MTAAERQYAPMAELVDAKTRRLVEEARQAGRLEAWRQGAPGSARAMERGCTCPSIDNHHGYRTDDRWVINLQCPVHGCLEKA